MSDEERKAEIVKLQDVSMEAGGVAIKNLAQAEKFCNMVHKSGIAPTSMDSPAKIFVAIQTGAEAGLGPMASLRSIYLVKGVPGWMGSAALALIRKHPNCVSCDVGTHNTRINDKQAGVDIDEVVGFCKTIRAVRDPDNYLEEISYFSYSDAVKAGLTKGKNAHMYSQWADDMLTWRAVSRHAKRYWSDALLGLDVVEVVRTYQDRPKSGSPVALPAPEDLPDGPDPLLESLSEDGMTEDERAIEKHAAALRKTDTDKVAPSEEQGKPLDSSMAKDGEIVDPDPLGVGEDMIEKDLRTAPDDVMNQLRDSVKKGVQANVDDDPAVRKPKPRRRTRKPGQSKLL